MSAGSAPQGSQSCSQFKSYTRVLSISTSLSLYHPDIPLWKCLPAPRRSLRGSHQLLLCSIREDEVRKGNCSYSVYAGPKLELVVQFRLKSLMLKSEITARASEIYDFLAPNVSFHGQLGDDSKEPLFIYVMSRIQSISHLDFVLVDDFPENSNRNFIWRKALMADIDDLNQTKQMKESKTWI